MGGSLGGARPKASVIDKNDDLNIGAWEYLVHKLAKLAQINTVDSQIKRFDCIKEKRIHVASAMTLLNRMDGESYDEGISYLDLEELWRRIVFNISKDNNSQNLELALDVIYAFRIAENYQKSKF